MKLEQQVTSLELSKRLKELGVKQESYFYYYPVYGPKIGGIQTYKYKIAPLNESGNNKYSAFTVAELGELLPYKWAVIKQMYGFQIFGIKKDAPLNYTMLGGHGISLPIILTEADARAKMLIYLLENKLITI